MAKMHRKGRHAMKYHPGGQRLLAAVLLLMLPMVFIACQADTQEADADKAVVEQVRPVKVYELKQNENRRLRKFPGTAQALQHTKVSFRVGGPLIALNAETGRRIQKGDVIARIDPRDFEIRIDSMEARLAASRANYAEARLQYDRYRQLVADNAAARADFDRVKAAFESAEAQVNADSKGLEDAKNALQDTTLYAPFSGYIHHQYAENNEMVQAGQPIVSMLDLSAMEIKIAVPEDLLPAVERFESYACRFTALPDNVYPAEFKEIGKQPNPSNRTYPLTLVIDSDEPMPIRPGMAAEVAITIKEKNGKPKFRVPMSAIVNGSDRQSFVWIVDPEAGTLKRQPVTVGSARQNGFIEISGDLTAGRLIAGAGAHTLTADQKVRVMEPPSETNIGNEL